MTDKPNGLYNKFRVSKYDREAKFFREFKDFVFVLVPGRDPAAVEALRAYAVGRGARESAFGLGPSGTVPRLAGISRGDRVPNA